jgi:hypothetical protein
MGMTQKRRPPAYKPPVDKSDDKPEDGDLAVLERDDDRGAPDFRRSRVERRDWRGEGVVGNYHTD